MRIDHIALWTNDIERLKMFYQKYFGANLGAKYINPKKQFTSYFLSFDSGCRIEIMHKPLLENSQNYKESINLGFAHFAISVGSKEKVDKLTELLRLDGYTVISNPRQTGDGYYESVISDPDHNSIEITI